MQRPTAVTVFGILNIVFGVLGVLGMLAIVAILMFAIGMMSTIMKGSADPALQIMQDSPASAKVIILLELVASGVVLAAGIGLLKMKEWGRKVSIGYSIYAIVAGLVGMLVMPLMKNATQNSGSEAAGTMGRVVERTVGGCFGLIYPILLIVFMTRPKIVAALRAPATEAPTI